MLTLGPRCLQGDPSAVPYAVKNVQEVLGQKPVFGICMGHQILGQAVGGATFKLKFGHHGGNHPIRFNDTGARRCPARPRFTQHPRVGSAAMQPAGALRELTCIGCGEAAHVGGLSGR